MSQRRYSTSMEVSSLGSTELNVDPHVGHMHSMIVADVHKRFKQLWRKNAVLSTGTDEHGMKVSPLFESN